MASVLVVEDDESVRQLLVDFLRENEGLEVDGARDGVEALYLIGRKKYAVVALDVMMPKMTGVDFLDSLRAMNFDPSVSSPEALPAVIVITAAPAEELPNLTIEDHFPGVVRGIFRKPIEVSTVGSAVAHEAQRRRT